MREDLCSSRAREPRRKKSGCANGSPPDRVRLSTWRSRERTADSTWAGRSLCGVSLTHRRPHAKLSGHGNPGGTTPLHAAPTNRATWCDGASGGNGPPALLRPGADVAPRPDRPRRGNLQPLPHRRHLGPARPRPPRPLAQRGGPSAPDPAHHLRRARRRAGVRRRPRRAPAAAARRPRRPSGAVVEARGRAPLHRGAAAPVRPRGGASLSRRSRAPLGGPARRAPHRPSNSLRRRIEPRSLARGRGALRGLRRGTAVAAPRAPPTIRRPCALAEAAPRGRCARRRG